MNPFRIFNRAPVSAVPRVAIHPETGATRITNGPAAPTPGDSRSADEREFGIELYVPGVEFRRGRFYFHTHPEVSRELLSSVAAEAAPLFSSDDEKAISAIRAQLKRADEQLCENSFLRVSGILPAYFQTQIDSAIASGQQPPPVPSYQERLAQTGQVRASLHRLKKELHEQAFAVIKPAVIKFSKAAWSLAKARDREEKGSLLQRWRLSFTPSPTLRSLAYLDLRSSEPLKDFEDTGTLEISVDPAQIYGYLLTIPGAGQPVVGPTDMAQERSRQRDLEDKRRQNEMDQEQKDREKQLAEISRQNDAIRHQAFDSPSLPNYTLRPAPAPAPSIAPAPEAAAAPAQAPAAAGHQP
jgi:hypothetical protein